MTKEHLNTQKRIRHFCLAFGTLVPVLLFLLSGATPLKAAPMNITINEILADPPTGGSYDANFDGVWDTYDDEFVELVNISSYPVDMTSWTLNDNRSLRHTFPNGTVLDPGAALVIFGGGSPPTPPTTDEPKWQYTMVQTASSGGLGLNNGGDTITLIDAMSTIIDAYTYGGEGGNDQSLTRYPDLGSDWALHSDVSDALPWGKAFSPGFMLNGQEFTSAPIPIPSAVWLLGSGLLGLVGLRRKFETSYEFNSFHR